ncbi:MAG: hypothetical protein HC930_10720 [Hydrococcus sp. SU_1_0]|nr:hypothetical protein [Hydrococcus sp. SU_1_0]NJO98907.1 hypothetical protein [Pleurocapsa sp. CRU_1_2]
MELFLFVLIVATILVCLLYFGYQRAEKILKSKVIFIHSNQINQNNLLLGKYSIPLQIHNSSQVEVIFPQLNESGDLIYTSQYYYLSKISIPTSDKHKHKMEFQVAKYLSKYIKEHLQTEKEIENLVLQYQQVHDLSKLILKSDMYSNQINIYEKAIEEIEKLLDKAKELEKMYIQIIREGLIGVKIANYNPNNIKNNQMVHQMKYKQVKDEYQYMKDTAHAYGELISQRK